MARQTKAERSATAKKAAATRKRNEAKNGGSDLNEQRDHRLGDGGRQLVAVQRKSGSRPLGPTFSSSWLETRPRGRGWENPTWE
jgi:hypothetical protein